ncbi:xylan alpha-1,2-glucuronidase [Marivirga lumbricoides]|uniref:Xylan alpha-1,2-glucuronidase n=1 Tax=Marivirga lumbricoides TaxID=1046115 RepID=A0ABQ1N272_9BACT|nr:xylan alpha-1,2-glucuronidase [Marivirga lumbricoides]
MKKAQHLFVFYLLLISQLSLGNSTDSLWLHYRTIENKKVLKDYQQAIQSISIQKGSETLDIINEEVKHALNTMLQQKTPTANKNSNSLIISKSISLKSGKNSSSLSNELAQLTDEGYLIQSIEGNTIITSKTDIGLLYGTFHFLRLLQTEQPIDDLSIVQSPKTQIRVLNHWDNLDRTVERGYAGFSIWNWHTLPEYIDQRYIEYARANASIGINGTVLTNVNANALVLTPSYIEKVKALADVFRPYGLKVYLTARFSAPMEIGGLKTADPLNSEVQKWWQQKTDEIYRSVPDFGGFLVKANSEGQPGPQNYGRTHVDGANMLAKALKPHNGIVMWRAFVYSEHDPSDRAKQAYSEFVPFDGQFADNVLVQVKNGAIDFQPREPFHPMFGAMPQTPLMMEFQITQEYLGFSTHLVFLPKLFEEVLQSDTYRKGKESIVAKVVDGTLHNKKLTGMAGVANIGTDDNWTGHPFGQANWYGFGRLAWDPYLSSEEIAEEWLRLTFSTNEDFVEPMKKLLIQSRETVVKYMTPLGLHHIMDAHHHYGPGPWISKMGRPDWTSVYYHKADSIGIGFDRTTSGSNATSQYADPVAAQFNNISNTPQKYLLWFHHVPWDYQMLNGKTLWNNLALTYQEGVDEVEEMVSTWHKMEPYISKLEFKEVEMLLSIQLKEAKWWKNACMLYFQQFSDKPFPAEMEKPEKSLEYYQSLKFPFAPGIRPKWD